MCIIVAIPAYTDMPSDETLRECFRRNPDGAGYMYADGKSVRIRKGFMTYNDFIKALEAEDIPDGTSVVLHFRIGTSGKVQPKCCHPFPISDMKEELQATRTESRWGLAHNGVISGRTTYDGWSDTMDFTAKVVAPLARMNPSFMHSTEAKELLKGACMSKLAILDNSGDLMLVGDFVEDKGVFYSNTTYLSVASDWSSYGSWWTKATADYYSTSDFKWDDDWDDDWDDELIASLPYLACQICPMNEDCARYGSDMGYECQSDLEALEVCADFSGTTIIEVADAVGFDWEEVGVKSEV